MLELPNEGRVLRKEKDKQSHQQRKVRDIALKGPTFGSRNQPTQIKNTGGGLKIEKITTWDLSTLFHGFFLHFDPSLIKKFQF